MKTVRFEDAWEDLKNKTDSSYALFSTAEDLSRIILTLIEARVDQGYTQRQLADKCGLKQSAIARMESLKTIPRLDTVIRVANALNHVVCVDAVTAKISDITIESMEITNSDKLNYAYSDEIGSATKEGLGYGVVS
jgi:transcriptional regulator with XRE-family HTH domain